VEVAMDLKNIVTRLVFSSMSMDYFLDKSFSHKLVFTRNSRFDEQKLKLEGYII
jgi:hypothetical protein